MPLHDWTRVTAGIVHDFHLAWIAELQRILNSQLLPNDYYCMAEQQMGEFERELRTFGSQQKEPLPVDANGGAYAVGGAVLTVAPAPPPPRTSVVDELDAAPLYAMKRRTLTIRHATDDRIVALLEIPSPGNKDRQRSVERFVDKAVAALQHGYHLLVIDLLPPGPSDPEGLCDLIWQGAAGHGFQPPPGHPIGAASFEVAGTIRCYAEPTAVGAALPEMPLFYEPGWYVTVPLQKTYDSAYEGVPRRWKEVIEQRMSL